MGSSWRRRRLHLRVVRTLKVPRTSGGSRHVGAVGIRDLLHSGWVGGSLSQPARRRRRHERQPAGRPRPLPALTLVRARAAFPGTVASPIPSPKSPTCTNTSMHMQPSQHYTLFPLSPHSFSGALRWCDHRCILISLSRLFHTLLLSLLAPISHSTPHHSPHAYTYIHLHVQQPQPTSPLPRPSVCARALRGGQCQQQQAFVQTPLPSAQANERKQIEQVGSSAPSVR